MEDQDWNFKYQLASHCICSLFAATSSSSFRICSVLFTPMVCNCCCRWRHQPYHSYLNCQLIFHMECITFVLIPLCFQSKQPLLISVGNPCLIYKHPKVGFISPLGYLSLRVIIEQPSSLSLCIQTECYCREADSYIARIPVPTCSASVFVFLIKS